MEKREWGSLKFRLSKNFVCKCQYAVRVKKKSTARGKIITGVRKGIKEINMEKIKAIDEIGEEAEVKGAALENNNDL